MTRSSLILLACFGLVAATGHSDAAQKPAQKAPPLKLAPGQSAVFVKNMHCAGCARKIARKLYGVKGVVKVQTNVKANRTIVTPQAKKKVSATAIWSAVKKAGFPPTKLVNSDGTYLPHPKTGAPQLTPNKSSGGEKTAGRSAGQPK